MKRENIQRDFLVYSHLLEVIAQSVFQMCMSRLLPRQLGRATNDYWKSDNSSVAPGRMWGESDKERLITAPSAPSLQYGNVLL